MVEDFQVLPHPASAFRGLVLETEDIDLLIYAVIHV